MKNKQDKKAARTLLWITNLALYVSIGIALLVVIALIFTVNDEGQLTSAWDIEVREQLTDFQVISENASIDDPKIVINKGGIQFASRSISYYILKSIDAVIVILPVILIILLLRKTVRSIQLQHPFTKENVLRIKYIAFILILISPYSLIKSLIYRSYIVNNIDVAGKVYTNIFSLSSGTNKNEIWLNLDINFQALLTGIVLLVIAEVFRAGVLIKEDNDSIL